MTVRGRCWVELQNNKVIRIFRTYYAAAASQAWDEKRVVEYPRVDAVKEIRQQVFERANNQCEKCGTLLTWTTMQMDEKQPRGKLIVPQGKFARPAGGEISLDNCQALCANCHVVGPDSKHGDRLPMFGKQTDGSKKEN